jgi:hypothetical protein
VELSGHLSAASTLRALNLDRRADDVLLRAVAAARRGIADLDGR